MNAAVIIVVLTTLLVHCGHCQQRVTFSAFQDTRKTLNMRSISNRQSPECTTAAGNNILTQTCGISSLQTTSPSAQSQYRAIICQQRCYDALLTFYTHCPNLQEAGTAFLMQTCPGNNAGTHNAGTHNAGSSAEAPTFFKALFLLTSIVMAMLLL